MTRGDDVSSAIIITYVVQVAENVDSVSNVRLIYRVQSFLRAQVTIGSCGLMDFVGGGDEE